MKRAVRVLLVEDDPSDAKLILRELRQAGFDPEWERVDSEAAFLAQLHAHWDIILSDFLMPEFGGLRALELFKQSGLQIPFILVSGTIGEEDAVTAMKMGAVDYLLKDRLARLGLAVTQALEQNRALRERKEAELALRESEERFRQLAENIDEVFWITDPANSTMLYISSAYEKIWGRSCASLYSAPQSWLDAIHPEDRETVRQAARTGLSTGTYNKTYRILRPDGTIRWIEDRAYPVRRADGVVYRIVGTAADITAKRTLEEQFRQSQKMEAFGLLAGGVAHDFNNLLSVVIGYCDLWLGKLPAEAPFVKPLKAIRSAGDRGAALTRQLLAFSRQAVLEPKVLDLNTVVRETEKMLDRLIGEDIRLTSSLSPELPRIKIDPGQIGQALLNLAVNARDAMPQGGELTIHTATADLDEAFVRSHPGARPGRHVQLSVSDTGCGMPPETIARIFEPFFTTKGIGKGTGLGLAVVHGVVVQSGGAIEVESKVGAGTTFKLFFPVTSEAVQAAGKAEVLVSHSGNKTILVVEDEDNLRELTAESLRSSGYTVLTARSGPDAVECANSRETDLDLLVTDVVMPGMSGRELADALQKRIPTLNIIFMSGYTDDSVMRYGIVHEKVAFLQKPFSPFELLKKVREVLSSRQKVLD